MNLRDDVRRLIARLAGRSPSAEDERLVALFRNRAVLKKELSAIDDDRYDIGRAQDRIDAADREFQRINGERTDANSEIDRARRLIAAYDAALATGTGACMFEGKMIDVPVITRARALLDEYARQKGE